VTFGCARRRSSTTPWKAERRYPADLASGRVPSLRAVVRDLGFGQPEVREGRQHFTSKPRRRRGIKHDDVNIAYTIGAAAFAPRLETGAVPGQRLSTLSACTPLSGI